MKNREMPSWYRIGEQLGNSVVVVEKRFYKVFSKNFISFFASFQLEVRISASTNIVFKMRTEFQDHGGMSIYPNWLGCKKGFFKLRSMAHCHLWLTCDDIKAIQINERINHGLGKEVYLIFY